MNLMVFWQHADGMIQGLMLLLIALSVVTWSLLLHRILQQKPRIQKHILGLKQQLEALDVRNRKRAVHVSAESARAVLEQGALNYLGAVRDASGWPQMTLGTISALSPFLGLFGTVWGIFHALLGLGHAGQAGLAMVAGPVGESLWMTGMGFAVAMPAVLAFNICNRLNKSLEHRLHQVAHEMLMEQLLAHDAAPDQGAQTV